MWTPNIGRGVLWPYAVSSKTSRCFLWTISFTPASRACLAPSLFLLCGASLVVGALLLYAMPASRVAVARIDDARKN